MKSLFVAFFWHMHQPIYKDPATGKYSLPWVRLHALKGYTDLPVLSEKYPDFRQTINFTPSLLIQLEDYIQNPAIKDDFLELTRKRADQLSPDEKLFILKNFFMNNLERVIQPNERYSELYHKRGGHFSSKETQTLLKRFNSQDYLDLQVLFNLMWFGFSAGKLYPRISELVKKNRNFSEEEKLEVLDLQWKVMKDIIPRLKKLLAEKKIELTCSPFYHPILPLLSKKRDQDMGFQWKEDALWQVREAKELFHRIFESYPAGMWPSEGSVSEGAAEIFAESDIRWIATDEEILLHSLGESRREDEIYEPYSFRSGDRAINIFFRDKLLSDLIGFGYHRSSHTEAVDDLIQKLERIQKHAEKLNGNHLVSIILDGENPWEYYPESGEKFLNLLMERLSHHQGLIPVTFSEYLDANPQSKPLKKLFAGSWINHNFDIWYRHHEDLLGWKYVKETREALTEAGNSLDPEIRKQAWNEIYMAEASDWYWWFGNEFFTETGDIFDYLFRSHLMQVFHLLKKRVPAFLRNPIKNLARPHIRFEPQGLMHPVIDGKVTNYYEWSNAGLYQREHVGGAMYEANPVIHSVYYGFNLSNFFIRLDCSLDAENTDNSKRHIMVHLHGVQNFDIKFPLAGAREYEVLQVHNHKHTKIESSSGQIVVDKIIEISIPFKILDAAENDTFNFSVALYENAVKIEEWPRYGLLKITVPGKNYESEIWTV